MSPSRERANLSIRVDHPGDDVLLAASSGKNVAPMVLEDGLRAHWLVSQCVVVGDARPFIGALATIDADAFTLWKAETDKPAEASVADLREEPDDAGHRPEGTPTALTEVAVS